jgi:hypothetical protein
MTVPHEQWLVVLSICIAIQGSFVGLLVARGLDQAEGPPIILIASQRSNPISHIRRIVIAHRQLSSILRCRMFWVRSESAILSMPPDTQSRSSYSLRRT